jgi:hypothetical protein
MVSAEFSPRGYEYANMYETHYQLPLLAYGKPAVQPKVEPLSKKQLDALK